MIELDGSQGEGGGQILRSALALSLITGQPFRLGDIRAGRNRPGLMAQHLSAVQIAKAVGGARVEGDRLHSGELAFFPRGLLHGRHHIDVGTAGATSLVLQTVALPLAFARAPSELRIGGGTHVRWSPCFHYLERQWRPYLGELGVALHLELEMAGFFPRGEGSLLAHIEPTEGLRPLRLGRSGPLVAVRGLSAVGQLPRTIAERQAREAERQLRGIARDVDFEIKELPAAGPGTLLLLLAEFERSRACFFALGEPRKRAEQVASEAVEQFEQFLASDAALDPWLADQLLLPMALADGESLLESVCITRHLLTNAAVIRAFLDASIEIEGEEGATGRVRVTPGRTRF